MGIRNVFFLSVTLIFLSCSPDEYTGLQEFQSLIDEAEKAIQRDDFAKAKSLYQNAEEIAIKIRWDCGRVTAKQNLSYVLSVEKDYLLAERTLLDAKELALKDSKCDGLSTVYGGLIFHYLFRLKDIAKAEITVDEVFVYRERIAQEEDFRKLVRSYAAEMRGAGFETAAAALDRRIDELPER